MNGKVEILEHGQEATYCANGVCKDEGPFFRVEEQQGIEIEVLDTC